MHVFSNEMTEYPRESGTFILHRKLGKIAFPVIVELDIEKFKISSTIILLDFVNFPSLVREG